MITLNADDTLNAALAECYVEIKGNRYNFMQAINVEAKMDKKKTDVPILGKTGKGNKSTGWIGTGSATFHYNTSIFRKMLYEFKKTGQDIYFDMYITNIGNGNTGNQTIILKGCNIDGGILAKFDADSEDVLEEELDFTFEDWEMPEEFKMLNGMKNA